MVGDDATAGGRDGGEGPFHQRVELLARQVHAAMVAEYDRLCPVTALLAILLAFTATPASSREPGRLLTREEAEEALAEYEPALGRCYLGLMADRLGLLHRRPEDETLIGDLLEVLPEELPVVLPEVLPPDKPPDGSSWMFVGAVPPESRTQ